MTWSAYLLRLVVLASVLFTLGFINRTIAVVQDDTPLFWAPTGVSLAVLLLGGMRWWPGVVLGSVLCVGFQIPPMRTLGPAAGIVLGNSVGVILSAWLLREKLSFRVTMPEPRDAVAFILVGVLLTATLDATFGLLSLTSAVYLDASRWPIVWMKWFGPHAISTAVLGPLILAWWHGPWPWTSPRKTAEFAGVLGITLVVSLALLGHPDQSWLPRTSLTFLFSQYPLATVLCPLVVWASVRFGQQGASACVALVLGVALLRTSQVSSTLPLDSAQHSILRISTMGGLIGGVGLIAAGVAGQWVRARKESEKALRETNERLREAELRYRTIFEQVGVGVARIESTTGRFLDINRRYCEIVGRSEAEMLSTTFMAITHPDDLAEDLSGLDRMLSGELRTFSMEKRYVRPDRTDVWVNLNVVPLWQKCESPSAHIAVVEDITERKRSEEALRASEERFRLLFERSLTGVYCSALGGGEVECNPAFVRMFGYDSREDLLKHPRSALYPSPVDRETFLARLHRERQISNLEITLRRKDGTLFEAIENVILVRDENGHETIHGTILEVTEFRRAERELRDRETRIRSIVETAVDAIVTIDHRGMIDSFNPAAERLFGYSAGEVLGQNVKRLMPPPYSIEHDGYIESFLTTGVKKIIGSGRVVIGLRKDGTQFPMELVVSEMLIEGQPMFTGIVRDITDRNRAENALRDSESRLRAIWDAEPECVKLVARDGTLLDMNPAGLCMVEASAREQAIGGNILRLVAPEHSDAFRRHLDDVFAGKARELAFEIIGLQGTRLWMETHAVPLRDRDGNVTAMLAITRNVTERKRTEERIRQREHELAHFARISVMGEMASGLAHEVNQPLTAVVNYCKGAKMRLAKRQVEDPELIAAIDDASREAHRAAEIIRGLARFVQKRDPREAKIRVNPTVREVVLLATAEARRSEARIEIDLALENPFVLADSVQIQQVLLNLVRNGLEAMEQSHASERVLKIRTAVVGNCVQVTVSDCGTGLSSEAQEKVFQPFYTTKLDGMGMGLPISKSIIDAHGGRMWVTSNEKQGATFEFTLPVIL